MKKAGAVSLWPAYKLRKGKPGGYFSDWVNPFHKEVTGSAQAPVFHELRHTVRSALFSKKVDRALIGLLIGHDTGLTDAEMTYTRVFDPDLKAAIETLSFPAVGVPKVYPPQ